MKKELSILTVCLLAVNLGAMPLDAPLQRAAAKAQQQASLTELAQASRCLRDISACTVLDWPAAARYHSQAIPAVKERQGRIEQYKKLLTKLPTNTHRHTPYTAENEKKALEKLKNHRFIFIGETHIHGIRPHVARLLKTIRQQNPGKRILLATEMLVTYSPTDELPFQKAGTTHPDIRPQGDDMNWILPLTKELNMDVLALDDRRLEQKYNSTGGFIYPVKLGNFIIDVDSSYREAVQIANSRYGQDISANPILMIYALHDFFGTSWWGVVQRNIQWTSYIKAVQKDYDVIVVYGGSGHLDTLEGVPSVPQQLGLTDYALITLSKVPTDKERQQLETLVKNRSNGTKTVGENYKQAFIQQESAPSVMHRYNAQIRKQHAQTISQAVALEKKLGVYNDKSLRLKMVFPQ